MSIVGWGLVCKVREGEAIWWFRLEFSNSRGKRFFTAKLFEFCYSRAANVAVIEGKTRRGVCQNSASLGIFTHVFRTAF
jgi:hypothetical protein